MLALPLLALLSSVPNAQAQTTVITSAISVVRSNATAAAHIKHDYSTPASLTYDSNLAQGPPLDSSTTGAVSDLYIKFIVSSDATISTCPAPFDASNTTGWTQMIYGLPWQVNEANAPGASNSSYKIIGIQTSRGLNYTEHLFHATNGTGFMRYSNGGGEQCGMNLPWQPTPTQVNGTDCEDTFAFPTLDNTRCAVVTLDGEYTKTNESFNKRDTMGDMTSLIDMMKTVAIEAAADMTNTSLVSESSNPALAQGQPFHWAGSYNTTSDLWIKFFVANSTLQDCPAPFAANKTAGWTSMRYGVPFQHPNATDHSTAIVMWQLSRELRSSEILYHAGWGNQFMSAEVGAQCGTNYPYDVGKPSAGPLSQCADVRVPAENVRCVNVVATSL